MELGAVAAALLRRWYVVVLGIAVTGGLVFGAYTLVSPTYTATGSMVLLPPDASVTDGANPWLQLGGLEQPASLVVAYLAGQEPRKKFAEQYPDATYDVVVDPLSRGPLVIMTIKAPDKSEVMGALQTALASVPVALTALQDEVDAPANSRVGSMPLSVDVEPTTVLSTTLRAMIAAAAVGLLLTLVAAIVVDRVLSQRKPKAQRATRDSKARSARGTTRKKAPARKKPADAAASAPTIADDEGEATRAGDGQRVSLRT